MNWWVKSKVWRHFYVVRLDEFHCFISSLMLAPTMVHTISEPLLWHATSKGLFSDEEELCFVFFLFFAIYEFVGLEMVLDVIPPTHFGQNYHKAQKKSSDFAKRWHIGLLTAATGTFEGATWDLSPWVNSHCASSFYITQGSVSGGVFGQNDLWIL